MELILLFQRDEEASTGSSSVDKGTCATSYVLGGFGGGTIWCDDEIFADCLIPDECESTCESPPR